MMESVKLVVIGGGSSYTPELIEGLIARAGSFPVRELVLVDVEEGAQKLRIVSALARRMIERAGASIELSTTLNRREALPGADYVVTQLRVGRLKAREWDETIPLKYGFIGQETTGPGGMMNGLRTVPVMLDIARDTEELCPNAPLINFTNPASIVTQALITHSSARAIGLCNAPIGSYKWISKALGAPMEDIYCEFVGLNHLHWISRVELRGEDVLDRLLSSEGEGAHGEDWNRAQIKGLRAIPSYYLKHFYSQRQTLASQLEQAQGGETRAQVVERLEDELFALYEDENLCVKPKQLEKRGGAFYSEAAVRLMASLHNDQGDVQTVNVRNGGTLPFLRDGDSIEVNCRIHKAGPAPLPVLRVPPGTEGLIAQVKEYERLTVEAAISGSREKALLALCAHPLTDSVDEAERMLDEMLLTNRAYLPRFFA